MFMEMNKTSEALDAYKETLQKHPNRFNSLYGAGVAAEKMGDMQMATAYFQQLLQVVGTVKSKRKEMEMARQFIKSTALR
jgi:hypothetical protein